MIDAVGRVIVYVNDPKVTGDFWINNFDFIKLSESKDMVELLPREGADTAIVFFNRVMVEKMNPEMNLGVPSILFSCKEFDQTYMDLKEKGVLVGEIVEMNGTRTFNFADNNHNYFAIREIE